MKLQFHNADPDNVDQFIKFLREGGRELLTDRVYIKLGNIGSQMNILEHTILHMGANMKRENQFFINRLRKKYLAYLRLERVDSIRCFTRP